MGYKLKVLIFGSRGLVGSSLARTLKNSNKISELILSTREDTNLFILDETQKIIHETMPDVIINAAAKVGGIVANNSGFSEYRKISHAVPWGRDYFYLNKSRSKIIYPDPLPNK